MKKIKDLKIGQWLKENAPDILETAGDLLPDAGVLSMIGRAIEKSGEISKEKKLQAHEHLKELYSLEVSDRDSARKRQASMAENNNHDIMFNIAGAVGLAAFGFLVYAIVFITIPSENKEIFIHLTGIVEGVALSIFGYFFGSAMLKNKSN